MELGDAKSCAQVVCAAKLLPRVQEHGLQTELCATRLGALQVC